jgi:tRNA-dihydrouridine synthase 3
MEPVEENLSLEFSEQKFICESILDSTENSEATLKQSAKNAIFLSQSKNGKKRPRDTRVESKDRLCNRLCNFSIIETCHYEHDASAYLNIKPFDLGPNCFQYEQFGFCSNGLMCRFDSCHIDTANAKTYQDVKKKKGLLNGLISMYCLRRYNNY